MSEAVRLTVVPEAAHVMPGARVSLSLTVRNTGGSDARYRLAVGGIPEAWCTLDTWHLTLGPGGHEQVQITVQPPRDTATGAGSYSLTVGVISEDDPNVWLSTIVPLTLTTADGVTMDVAPPAVEGREARFRITYLNLSDAPVAVALVARDNEDALRFSARPDTPVIVPSGGGGPVTVHVVPKERKTFGEPHPYEIEFRGVQLGAEQTTNPLLVRRARFVYVPRYTARYLPLWLRRTPRWALLPPFVLLLLLLVFAGGRTLAIPAMRAVFTPTPSTPHLRTMRPGRPQARVLAQTVFAPRPSIRRFTLVHNRQGRPYELVWRARAATHLTLDGRSVSCCRLVLHAPLQSATYRLVATKGSRRATAQLRVVVDARTTDTHAFVLTTPHIARFAVHLRKGKLYVTWQVRNAVHVWLQADTPVTSQASPSRRRVRNTVHVWLQGRPVSYAGERVVPPGTSWLQLVAANDVGIQRRRLRLAAANDVGIQQRRPHLEATNDVGIRQRRLRLAHSGPSATSILHPTATPPLRPTKLPRRAPR